MKRRDFFGKLGVLAAGFSVLPSAMTYARANWKVTKSGLWRVNPDWVNAPYEWYFYEYRYAAIPNPAIIPILFKRTVEESGSEFALLPGLVPKWANPVTKSWHAGPLPAFEGMQRLESANPVRMTAAGLVVSPQARRPSAEEPSS